MREVCYALMVDPQKRQIRSSLRAAQLTGSFDEADGVGADTHTLQSVYTSPSAQPSFGSDEARSMPRLRHESSFQARMDSSWRESVLAMAYRREPRDPHNRLRHITDSVSPNASVHGGGGSATFSRLTMTGSSPGRALGSPSPLRFSNWSHHWWGRRPSDDMFGDFKAQPPPASSEPPKPAAPLPPPGLPTPPSPTAPRHMFIRTVPPPTPSQTRFRRAFGLLERSPLAQRLMGPKGWRQVHPQTVATHDSDSSARTERTTCTSQSSSQSSLAISSESAPLRLPPSLVSGCDQEHPLEHPRLGRDDAHAARVPKPPTPHPSPHPRAARRLVFTD